MIDIPEPNKGEDVFEWARRMAAAVRRLVPTESVDILPRIGSNSTSYTLRRRKRGGTSAGVARHPFQVFLVPPPEDEDPDSKGWFKVERNSTLTHGPGPLDKVLITDLDTPLQIPLTGDRAYIWLEVDVRPMRAATPAVPTARIKTGEKWLVENDDEFFPGHARFNTDGGALGESIPDDLEQTHFIVPIAERITHDPDDPFEPKSALTLDAVFRLHQVLKTHLTMMRTCYSAEHAAVEIDYVRPGLTHLYQTDIEE